jgi:hypothetical protein
MGGERCVHQIFTLASSYWTSGETDRFPELYKTKNGRRPITLTTMTFVVAP